MLTQAEIRRLRSLRDKRHREALGLFAVEGGRIVDELIAGGFAFEELYATGEWGGAGARAVGAAEMGRISHFPTPSSVFAVARIPRRKLAPGGLARGFTLALDGVQDPGNVGTLLRIADWYGVDRVLLSPDCADLHSPKVVRASMGSFARVPAHVAELAPALRMAGVPVLGCDVEGEDVRSVGPAADAVAVIGSEGRGLSPAVREAVTRRVTIPRRGRAESLNAAVAGGIVCDNLRR